jgi:hypothetical protein
MLSHASGHGLGGHDFGLSLMGCLDALGALMNWFENALIYVAHAIGSFIALVFTSAVTAIFAGIMAKHALEVQAKRVPMLGPVLYVKLMVGPFLYYVMLGVIKYSGIADTDIRNALAALIGMMGPEIILSLALRMAKARGLISDLPPENGDKS